MKVILLRAAVLALAVTPAFAQQPVPQPGQARPVEKEVNAPTFRATQVLGTKVMLAGEATAGTVEDLVFDEAGNLEYLVVSNGGKLTTVPWEAAKFNVEKKTAVLTLTEEKFKLIPTYTTTTYPQYYTPTYRTEVYKYYDLTPRDLRKLERRR